jgi:N-acetylglutamate synthase-like GNAT family acetyltransferase
MDARALREAYDDQLREDAEVARAQSVVRHPPLLWAVFGDGGMITYRDLAGAAGEALDALLDRSVAHFRDATHVGTVEWKTRGHDLPADLPERLVAHGFVAQEAETVMIGPAADLAVDVALPDGVRVRRVEVGPQLLDEVTLAGAMQAHVFGGSAGRDPQQVAEQLAADPTHLQLWVAEAGGAVVAAGSLDVVRGTEFAGLWGGAVLAEWRGRGLYRALVAARARAALALGVRYLHSDCTAMSRPILERSGLTAVTTTTPYLWTRAEAPAVSSKS